MADIKAKINNIKAKINKIKIFTLFKIRESISFVSLFNLVKLCRKNFY